ncbi:MAG: Gfo/Idh/MocA family oxidoreductase [Acidobacteriota bacterium]
MSTAGIGVGTEAKRSIGVGVIGVGSLGRHHARIYSQLPGVRLVGVADVREERAREVAGVYGARAYTDYRGLLGRVEAVSIAVPTTLHAEIGAAFLREGAHVLVEKPMAADLAGADRLLEAAEAAGRVLQVGHVERFNPVLAAVLDQIRGPRFFEGHRLGVFVPRSLDVDVILDLMIHDLDLVLWLTGEEIVDIRAVGIPILTPRVDIANARLQFSGGCVANLTASRVSRERVRKLRLFQFHDYISLDFHGRTVEMYSLAEANGERRVVERHPTVTEAEPLREELRAFLQAVRTGEAPRQCCSGEQGRAALAAALQVVNLARQAL